MINIAVINFSTVITPSQLSTGIAAISNQLTSHFLPAWGISASLFIFTNLLSIPASYWRVYIFDNTTQALVLGYHNITNNSIPTSYIFAQTAKLYNYPWTLVTSHEILEMLVDPQINLTVLNSDTYGRPLFYAYEICDPVQSPTYGYYIGNIQVSNFVLPSWFSKTNPPNSKFDYRGFLKTPFTLLKGGYISVLNVYTSSGWITIKGDNLQKNVLSHNDINYYEIIDSEYQFTRIGTRKKYFDKLNIDNSQNKLNIMTNNAIDDNSNSTSNDKLNNTTTVQSNNTIKDTTTVKSNNTIKDTTIVQSNNTIKDTTIVQSNNTIKDTTTVQSNDKLNNTTTVQSNNTIKDTTTVQSNNIMKNNLNSITNDSSDSMHYDSSSITTISNDLNGINNSPNVIIKFNNMDTINKTNVATIPINSPNITVKSNNINTINKTNIINTSDTTDKINIINTSNTTDKINTTNTTEITNKINTTSTTEITNKMNISGNSPKLPNKIDLNKQTVRSNIINNHITLHGTVLYPPLRL